MSRRVSVIVGLVMLGLALTVLAGSLGMMRLPGDQRGYEPRQPIAFSHRLHAGEMEIACVYCHAGAERSKVAGVPPLSTCMNCHRFVSATLGAVRAEDEAAGKENRAAQRVISPELAKLYDAVGLDGQLKPDPGKEPKPIAWTRVHNLPSFVSFDHSRHVGAGVACQTCHGPVETMERVRQVPDLSMGWCVNCHRQVNVSGVGGKPVNASTDCSACHH